jgi:hypothetical protein
MSAISLFGNFLFSSKSSETTYGCVRNPIELRRHGARCCTRTTSRPCTCRLENSRHTAGQESPAKNVPLVGLETGAGPALPGCQFGHLMKNELSSDLTLYILRYIFSSFTELPSKLSIELLQGRLGVQPIKLCESRQVKQ